MATTSALLEIVGKLYNHPTYSDATLNFNDEKYNLMLIVVEKFASRLFKEFEADSVTSAVAPPAEPAPSESAPSFDPTTDQVASSLSLLISRLHPTKKVTTFADPRISKETVNSVLESLYGKNLDITLSNIGEVYVLSSKFGIENLVTKCMTVFEDNTKIETFLDSYAQALSEDSLTIRLHFNVLLEKLEMLPRDKLLEFIPRLKFESMLEIVKTDKLMCNEDLVYEMTDSWCRVHSNKDNNANAIDLMSHIRWNAVSIDLLLGKIRDNLNIDRKTYVQALESRVKLLSADSSHSRPRSANAFAIGKIGGTYNGYRLITKTEVESIQFSKLLCKRYFGKNGISCLDNFNSDVVCCETAPLAVFHNDSSNKWIRLFGSSVKITEYPCLSCSSLMKEPITPEILNTIHISTDSIRPSWSEHNTGLFVSNDIKLV